MLDEAIAGLAIISHGVYVDATFGRGGHARAILAKLDQQGRLIVFDRDQQAIAAANELAGEDARVSVRHAAFASMLALLPEMVGKVNGILLDLGMSSPQVDDPARGFSFIHDGPLDMRMDHRGEITAAQWLAVTKEQDMARAFKEYGEERFAKRIARAIVAARSAEPLTSTKQLAEIVAKAHPRWEKHKHPATRVFQAIRIAINDEFGQLSAALSQALELLAIGGRLCVISFHSLEDRIVKQFMQREQMGGTSTRGMPFALGEARLICHGRAIKPSLAEVNQNPRARSAVLRIAEKIA